MPINWQRSILAKVLKQVWSAKPGSSNFHFDMSRFQNINEPQLFSLLFSFFLLPAMIFSVCLRNYRLRVSLMVQHLCKLSNMYVDSSTLWILNLLLFCIWLFHSCNFRGQSIIWKSNTRRLRKLIIAYLPEGMLSFKLFKNQNIIIQSIAIVSTMCTVLSPLFLMDLIKHQHLFF